MSAHTPGPWSVCTEAPNVTWVEGQTIYSEPTGTRVADAFLWAFSGEEGVAANARLIAAAPELLEALDDMQQWVCAFAYGKGASAHSEVMKSPRMQKARAAIAKAKGESV